MRPPRKHGIYLLHFEPRYRHAGHYLGFSDEIQERVRQHRSGQSGVRMLSAAAKAGCVMFLVRTWPGGRKDERRMKGLRNAKRVGSLARICPACLALKSIAEGQAWLARIAKESEEAAIQQFAALTEGMSESEIEDYCASRMDEVK